MSMEARQAQSNGLLFVPSCYILFFPIQDRVMTATSLKEKAREELRIYAIVAAYLYVCFAALLVFESSLQPESSGGFVPHGIAVIKALVLGKFLLLGRAVGAGTRVHTRTVAGRIATRCVFLLVVLVLLTMLEEILVGLIHGKAIAATAAELTQRLGLKAFAKCVIMLLVLLPLVTLEELNSALGDGLLRRTLLGVDERRKSG